MLETLKLRIFRENFAMKKLILVLFLFSFDVHATSFTCLKFYYDKYGQIHDIECKYARQSPEVRCFDKGDLGDGNFYWWNGKECEKIKIAEKCRKHGGNWYQVQLMQNDVPTKIITHTCVCMGKLVWNGEKCVNQVPLSYRKNVYKAWCERLRKTVVVYVPNIKKMSK